MWKSDLIYQMLPLYQECELVAEIIIISNSQLAIDDSLRFSSVNLSKVRFYSTGENNYVNASWNIGAIMAKHTVVLANDDILIENITSLLCLGRDEGNSTVGRKPGRSCFKYFQETEVIRHDHRLTYPVKIPLTPYF